MANYTRKPTCRYCRERGHNIKTCAKVREDADKGYYAAQLHMENLERKAKWKAEDEKYYGKTKRKCSYCGETGHNSRTCNKKQDTASEKQRGLARFRKHFIEACEKHGLGVGAMVKVSTADYRNAGKDMLLYGMVIGFHAEGINDPMMRVPFNIARLVLSIQIPGFARQTGAKGSDFRKVALPVEIYRELGHSATVERMGPRVNTIAGPVKKARVRKYFSHQWHKGKEGLELILPKNEKY